MRNGNTIQIRTCLLWSELREKDVIKWVNEYILLLLIK
jgi:hypothetical protein